MKKGRPPTNEPGSKNFGGTQTFRHQADRIPQSGMLQPLTFVTIWASTHGGMGSVLSWNQWFCR